MVKRIKSEMRFVRKGGGVLFEKRFYHHTVLEDYVGKNVEVFKVKVPEKDMLRVFDYDFERVYLCDIDLIQRERKE